MTDLVDRVGEIIDPLLYEVAQDGLSTREEQLQEARGTARAAIAAVLDDLFRPSVDMGVSGAKAVTAVWKRDRTADYDAAVDAFRVMIAVKQKELGL